MRQFQKRLGRASTLELSGIVTRVATVLGDTEGWDTAKDVASVLGCRPRETGNALAMLVERGVVERRRDGDGPAEYRSRGR